MADLKQILSALLRDLGKARFSSDLYSRSIARYYENDYLLRRFPVPRADIEEVEIDLKFSIIDVPNNIANEEGREANVAFCLERIVEDLVSTYLDEARDFADNNIEIKEKLREYMGGKTFNSPALRVELRRVFMRYFIESYSHLIDEKGNFNNDKALKDLKRPLRWAHERFRSETTDMDDFREILANLFDYVYSRTDFKLVLETNTTHIKEIWLSKSDVALDIEVNGHTLAQLTESALSSIKIKAVVKNSVWNEVVTGRHEMQTTLTPE